MIWSFILGFGKEVATPFLTEVERYSPFGRQTHTADRTVLESKEFVKTVIDPLGLSCPPGGDKYYYFYFGLSLNNVFIFSNCAGVSVHGKVCYFFFFVATLILVYFSLERDQNCTELKGAKIQAR